MRWIVDLVYILVILLTLPIWLTRMIRTGKIRTDWRGRCGHVPAALAGAADPGVSRVLIHAVSVGEVNATRGLVANLSAAGLDVVIATTTDTGFARATSLFGQRHHVVRYPFDLSWMASRFLKAISPSQVILVELEVWPNFVSACSRSSIPVLVINGRLTERSARRYRWIGPLVRRTFSRITWVGAQDEAYAKRFAALGVPKERIEAVGNMKWDNARCEEGVDGSEVLRDELGIDLDRPLIVAGSTAPGEHELLRDALPAGCQLLCAPRKPEWFDGAAAALEGCRRRSMVGERGGGPGGPTDFFLLDSIGELSKAYAIADLAIVGRSFVELHGSDVTEPIGLGVPTVVGPAVDDFRQMVDAFLAGDGIVQVSPAELASTVSGLMNDPEARRGLANRGRSIILANQGATDRYASHIISILDT